MGHSRSGTVQNHHRKVCKMYIATLLFLPLGHHHVNIMYFSCTAMFYLPIHCSYYRGAQGIIVVYDVTNQVSVQQHHIIHHHDCLHDITNQACNQRPPKSITQASFDNIRKWLEEISRYAGSNVRQKLKTLYLLIENHTYICMIYFGPIEILFLSRRLKFLQLAKNSLKDFFDPFYSN